MERYQDRYRYPDDVELHDKQPDFWGARPHQCPFRIMSRSYTKDQ